MVAGDIPAVELLEEAALELGISIFAKVKLEHVCHVGRVGTPGIFIVAEVVELEHL
jgi:hypothetical protein